MKETQNSGECSPTVYTPAAPAGPAPLVSVIIPCYTSSHSEGEILRETLDTVAAQTCRDYELVVVDDGSPLDVGAIIASHQPAVVLRQANAGTAAARNAGMRASRGRFLVFLDDDDRLLPHALEAGLRCFEEHPECGFVIGRREEMAHDGTPSAWSPPAMPRDSHLYYTLLSFRWYILPPSAVMFRREVVEGVGGFRDPWGADDLDLFLRVARLYPAWYYDSPAVTRHRRYGTSSAGDTERMLSGIRTIYARQWPVVRGDPEGEAAFRQGLTRLTNLFTDRLAQNVADRARAGEWRRALKGTLLLARVRPRRLVGVAAELTGFASGKRARSGVQKI
jgi:glycosyltransferase involved in cell wall biosynthesis